MQKMRNVTVDNRFAALLGEKRLRISTVARETGISRATLSKLYYGCGKALSYEVLAKLCAYLGCEVGDLLAVSEGGDMK